MSNITSAGVPIEVEGKEYEFSPLTLEDYEWLENWLKQRAIGVGYAAIPEDAPVEDKEKLMRAVVSEANKINVMGEGGLDQLVSIAGLARAVWRMLQRKNPGFPLSTVQRWIQSNSIREVILPKIGPLLRGGSEETNGHVEKKVSTKRKNH